MWCWWWLGYLSQTPWRSDEDSTAETTIDLDTSDDATEAHGTDEYTIDEDSNEGYSTNTENYTDEDAEETEAGMAGPGVAEADEELMHNLDIGLLRPGTFCNAYLSHAFAWLLPVQIFITRIFSTCSYGISSKV